MKVYCLLLLCILFVSPSYLIQPVAQILDSGFRPTLAGRQSGVTDIFRRSDGKLVMIGDFRVIGGVRRDLVAVVNSDYSVDTTFDAGEMSSNQSTLYASCGAAQPDGKILFTGYFSRVNGAPVSQPLRLNLDGSIDASFNVGTGTGGGIKAMVVLPNGKIVISGYFTQFNGQAVPPIIRLNPDGSRDQTFNAIINGFPPVDTILVQPDGKLIVTGEIYSIPGGQPLGIIRLNENGSVDNTFSIGTAPNAFIQSTALLPDGKILVGGPFSTINQVERHSLARLNSNGSVDTSFTAQTFLTSFAYPVDFAPLANGQTIVVGPFDSINGVSRDGVARLNLNGSVDSSYSPTINEFLPTADIFSVFLLPDNEILVTGNFNLVNQDVRLGIAQLNNDGTTDPSPVPVAKSIGTAQAIASQPDGKLILGGLFSTINGSMNYGIGRLNIDGTTDPSFVSGKGLLDVTPGGGNSSHYLRALALRNDAKLIAGGSFRAYDNVIRPNNIRITSNGALDLTFSGAENLGNSIVHDIAIQADGRTLIACESCAKGVVRRNEDGSVDSSFVTGTGANAAVRAIAVQSDGKIIIGGSFTSVSGTPRSRIARLGTDGSVDLSFNTSVGANGFVTDVAVQSDGKVLVGGAFTTVNGELRNRIARLNVDGSLDLSFDPGLGADNQINALKVQTNGGVLVGGSFDSFSGVSRSKLARLLPGGSLDPSFGGGLTIEGIPGSTASIQALVETPSGLVIAGAFIKVNGQSRSGVARLFSSAPAIPFDFDGDRKTDIGIFRPNGPASEWWINRSGNGQTFALQFGSSTDRITPADYTGDGKADIAFFRPASGEWYVLRSEDFSFFALPFGTNGDVPVPADYDADGKADFAVFRPSNSNWYISQSSGAPTQIFQFGVMGDVPVVADYDGDGKADVGIFRQAAGGAEWWINRSTAGPLAMQFGANTDKPVQGDYTGDGKADIAIWRPSNGNWLIVRSEDFSFFGFPFGASGDVVAPGDYDGDGKFDPTVFRPSNATWFIGRTTAGTQIVQFGATGDQPIPNSFVP